MLGFDLLRYFSNSSLNLSIAEDMGETAEGPSGHIVVCLGGQLIPGLILSQISRSSSNSCLLPLPSIILCRIFSNQLVETT